MGVIAYIGFGANLGNPLLKFQEAINELTSLANVRIIARSNAFETRPVGLVDGGPDFINAVIAVETDVTAQDLILEMRRIEKKLGKSASHKSDLSRLIDLDLLFYGSEIIDSDDLTVPHPRLLTRAFVLGPMAEIAPDFEHPVEKKSIITLLETLDANERETLKPVGSSSSRRSLP